jgi:hypothetical protein
MDLLLESQSGKLRQKVLIVNISLLGVGIQFWGALVPQQTVTLIPSNSSFNVYPCRVMWVKPLGSELYSEAGLEFWGIAKLIPR